MKQLSAAIRSTILAIGLGAGLVATGGAADRAPLPRFERVMLAPAPKPIRDFELTDQDGKPFRFSSLRGRPALVFFGFAHCPDICPATLTKLQMLRKSANPGLRTLPVVMISVDGERDTPARMKEYLRDFSADFVGLTGAPHRVREIAAQFPAVFFKGSPRDSADSYLVQHTPQVYALDRAGMLRAEFYDATLEAIEGVSGALLEE